MNKDDQTAIASTLKILLDIKQKFKNDGQLKGSIRCTCGGTVNYAVAKVNKHVWAACDTCTIRFIE